MRVNTPLVHIFTVSYQSVWKFQIQKSFLFVKKLHVKKLFDTWQKSVQDTFLADVKKFIYSSLSVDSTPDISHIDQMTLIIKYVSPVDGLPCKKF